MARQLSSVQSCSFLMRVELFAEQVIPILRRAEMA
jgi:hypothetical protein